MSWATNYVNPNNLNIPYQGIVQDGRLFTDYSPSAMLNDKIRESNKINSNTKYKDYLIKNAKLIMNNNFNSAGLTSDSNSNLGRNYPYAFNDVNDSTIPAGYEMSQPKNLYLSREKLVSNQVRPLIQNFN
jgi:hypothetical protein